MARARRSPLGPWCGTDARCGSAAWRRDGLGFLHDLHPGDTVSLHWDWVCDRLSAIQTKALERYTRRMLALANRASAPAALA